MQEPTQKLCIGYISDKDPVTQVIFLYYVIKLHECKWCWHLGLAVILTTLKSKYISSKKYILIDMLNPQLLPVFSLKKYFNL